MAFRVLTGEIAHETNTFSVVPTTMENFRKRVFLTANEIPAQRRGTRSEFGATFEAADKYGWTLSHPLAASANPSGTVTRDTFETLTALLLAGADSGPNGNIDGALLHLHGAMVAEGFEDGEGEILRRLRAKIGPDIPIVVTLDLHGNITQLMADSANALIAVRTYPHVDYYERAWQGADLLQKAMLGTIKPRTVIAKRPMLRGLNGGRTQIGPMRELIERGGELEREGRALVVSICSGFTAADIYDIGPSVTVTTDDNNQAGQAIAEEFMDYAWKTRDYLSVTNWPIPEALRHAKSGEGKHDRPLVMADVTDNPGSGHYGDATDLLRHDRRGPAKRRLLRHLRPRSRPRRPIHRRRQHRQHHHRRQARRPRRRRPPHRHRRNRHPRQRPLSNLRPHGRRRPARLRPLRPAPGRRHRHRPHQQ